MYKTFYQQSIWQDGMQLLKKIYSLTTNFPSEEKYSLTSQLRRSANSIIANFAESYGRYFYKDKIRVLYISRGEIEETRSHLLVAHQLQFITDQAYFELEKSYNQLCKDLNSYIIDLNKKNINS